MTSIAAVGLYAGLNALILIWISVSTSMLRNSLGIFVGDGGHPHLIRIMRGHANAIETVPVALILMLLMASLGAPAWVVHLFGIALTVGRVLHALHFIAEDAPRWQRFAGAGLSTLVLGLGAIGTIGHALWQML